MESSPATTSLTTQEGGNSELFHVLDGSVLEGGGQILRNSVAYSALLRKRLRITTIRAGRSRPGLRMQHLKGIQLVRELCNGELEGDEISSTSMSLLPRELQPSGTDFFVDIETAGSTTLLIQAILPVLLFLPTTTLGSSSSWSKPSTVTLIGGTNATQSPQIDYFIHVFLPMAEKMFGIGRVRAHVLRRGYYPKGGGKVRLEVTPLAPGESLSGIDLTERGEVTKINGYIFVGGVLPEAMAWEMHRQAVHDLELAPKLGKYRFPGLGQDLKVVKESKASGGGSGLVLWAETESGCVVAGSGLGERTKKAKSVAKEATSMLAENLASGACLDEFLQDQLIIFMTLAKGPSTFLTGPLTLHTQTAMWVATELTGVTFDVQQSNDGLRTLVKCHGIGISSSQEITTN